MKIILITLTVLAFAGCSDKSNKKTDAFVSTALEFLSQLENVAIDEATARRLSKESEQVGQMFEMMNHDERVDGVSRILIHVKKDGRLESYILQAANPLHSISAQSYLMDLLNDLNMAKGEAEVASKARTIAELVVSEVEKSRSTSI